MQYLIILSGENVFFETSVGDAPIGELIIGFLASRLVDAPTDELALAQAKRDLLVQWNQSFNANRKFGMPHLTLERMMRLERARSPKLAHDYIWFKNIEEKQQLLEELCVLPKPWFWQKEAQEVSIEDVTRHERARMRSLPHGIKQ